MTDRKAYLHKYCQEHKEQYARYNQKWRRRLKLKVLSHYSSSEPYCADCGEKRLVCLSVDHIEGGGSRHRRELGRSSGTRFYSWLEQNNFPEGYQILCMNCQFVKRALKENESSAHTSN